MNASSPRRALWWQLSIWAVVALYTVYLIWAQPAMSVFDWVNVLTHEAGHLILLPFSHDSSIAGGPIAMLGIPFLIFLAYWFQEEGLGAAGAIWWLGEALRFLGFYIGPDRAQAVELLQAKPDWDTLHQWFGTAITDRYLAHAAIVGGIGIMLVGLLAALAMILIGQSRFRPSQSEASPISPDLLPPSVSIGASRPSKDTLKK